MSREIKSVLYVIVILQFCVIALLAGMIAEGDIAIIFYLFGVILPLVCLIVFVTAVFRLSMKSNTQNRSNLIKLSDAEGE